jgi:hypothetical protein
MNYSKVITTGLGFLLGLVVYHFVKKALNGNGSVSVSEEETANAIGLKGLRRLYQETKFAVNMKTAQLGLALLDAQKTTMDHRVGVLVYLHVQKQKDKK